LGKETEPLQGGRPVFTGERGGRCSRDLHKAASAVVRLLGVRLPGPSRLGLVTPGGTVGTTVANGVVGGAMLVACGGAVDLPDVLHGTAVTTVADGIVGGATWEAGGGAVGLPDVSPVAFVVLWDLATKSMVVASRLDEHRNPVVGRGAVATRSRVLYSSGPPKW
jgi:hypothetical protein